MSWTEHEIYACSIVDRFEKVAGLFPDRLAVRSDGADLSYEDLNVCSNRVARAILDAEGSSEVPVALLFKSPDGLCAPMLGSLKAGRFFTPLDPGYPREQLAHIIADSHTNLILTDSQHHQLARDLAAGRVTVLDVDEISLSGVPERIGIQSGAHAPCSVIYTSGSTGRPKGVMQSNGAFLKRSGFNILNISPQDRCGLFAAVATGNAVAAVFEALLNGASVFHFDARGNGLVAIRPWIIDNGLTILRSGSPLFRSFTETLTDGDTLENIRALYVTSQTVFPSDFEAYKKFFGSNCIFVTGLSSTECSLNSCYYLDKSCEITTKTVPVGYPAPDVERRLVDDQGNEVASGETGEIVVYSRHLALGYWRDPERTARTFRQDPKGTGKRMLYTGDLGRMQPDGCLEVVGRKDFVVKIRGNRVEISGIESLLLAHPDVKEAVVVVRKDAAGNSRLAAFVVPRQNGSLSTGKLRAYLGERLPPFNIPSYIVQIDALPYLPNGKVARLALPNPTSERPDLDGPYIQHRNALEAELCRTWAQVLGLNRVGIHDDFLDLGGDSLLAAALLAQIQQIYKRQIPLAMLVQANTVAKMAGILEGEPIVPRTDVLLCIQPKGDRPPFFCVHASGGHAYGFTPLARRLGEQQPFYGFEAPGRDDEQPPLERIEDMAALYIREMRMVQPQGPYYIGGCSWGGRVALEMAQQLRETGQQVGALVLLDSGCADTPSLGHTAYAILSRLRWKLAIRTRLRGVVDRSARARLAKRKLSDAITIAGRCYGLKPYPGKIIYFRSSAWGKDDVDRRHEWERLALGGIEIIEVPGTHSSMLEEPHVEVLAARLAEKLASAQHEVETPLARKA